MTSVTHRWVRLGRRKTAAIVCSGLLAFTLAAGISAVRIPVPRVHDEFSYLLSADTFAGGRLSNPTHPFWIHFETFHVLQQPSYASKYPPGQGLLLAVGMLAGHPIVGAWLATGLAVAACCWMFQGLFPGRWALVGAALVAFHHGVQFHWGQTYWGGAVPMLGGALLFGAWVRLRRRPTMRDALWLAVGVAILANSRPYEGLIASAAVGVSLAWRWLSGHFELAAIARRCVVPAAVAFAVVGCAMVYYNVRVTGEAWLLPYQLQEATYSDTPMFVFQSPRPVAPYRHAAIRDFYEGWVRAWYLEQQSLWASFRHRVGLLPFFFTPFLAMSVVSIPWIWRSSRMRFAIGTSAFAFAATLPVVWEPRPHFLAVVAPLLFAVSVQGLRQIRVWADGKGVRFVAVVVVGHICVFFLALLGYARAEIPPWAVERAEMVERLEGEAGKHLVIVQYGAEHSSHEEWVWNDADIEASKIVWARTLDGEATKRLRDHFADRRVWTVYADVRPAPLVQLQ